MGNHKISRRDIFRTGGLAAAAGALGSGSAVALAAAAAPAKPTTNRTDNIYTRIGARPFINCTATYTINGGTLTLEEVKEAMDEASRYSVNIDELMDKVGKRIAQLLQVDAAMVSAGAAAAATHATAGCIAGCDPEKMQQLPDLTGLKSEVIMPKQSRNVYDHAIRAVGVKIVEIDTPEDFRAAFSKRTAMVAVLGTGEPHGKIRLEEISEIARKAGVPVFVDAAAELPTPPNKYLSRGADMVCHSGGKIIRGPQCAGLLLGRKDLIEAAWANSSPHHSNGRALKVGKEEIMGMLAAVDAWINKRNIESEYRMWNGWYADMTKTLTQLPGIRTNVHPPAGASPFPVLNVAWDKEKYGINAGEVYDLLLNGEPRVMSHAGGEGYSFIIRPAAMQAGDEKLVAARLVEIFRQNAGPKSRPAPASPVSVAGRWDTEVRYLVGHAHHTLFLEQDGNKLTGTHRGRTLQGDMAGIVDGDKVKVHSSLRIQGQTLHYKFMGTVSGDSMQGDVDLGEYGKATFTATRHHYRSA